MKYDSKIGNAANVRVRYAEAIKVTINSPRIVEQYKIGILQVSN